MQATSGVPSASWQPSASGQAPASQAAQFSTEKAEKESLQQSHEVEIQAVRSQLSTAMTEINSLKQSIAHQAQELQDELATVKAEQKSMKEEWKGRVQSLESGLDKAMDDISTVKAERVSLGQEWEERTQSLRDQLSTAKNEKQLMEKEMQSLRDQLSAANEANGSLRGQLSTAGDTIESLVKSKQELEARYCGATESSESKSRLLELHISILDNYDLEGAESQDVLAEMEKLFGMAEQYTGSTTEMVSMPKYMPRITLVGKAAEIPEPNLAAARRLWISSRCGSLALDVAQAFFMQGEISSAQFALLPWIHASLDRAVTTICEKSTLTPDLAISSAWILQGLVYTATVAREWSSAWNPKIEEMLAQMAYWLGEHVSDEASLLMVIVGQVNEIVTTHEPPSTSISPSIVSESRRIDSANSSIPDGMTMVVDISGIFILFTADDNIFIFGANEVKSVELDLRCGIMMIKFEQAVKGLPANLMELRLLDLHSPAEVFERHQELLESVLTKDRIEYTIPAKRRRLR